MDKGLNLCPICQGKGQYPVCEKCGEVLYQQQEAVVKQSTPLPSAIVPLYYKERFWDKSLALSSDSPPAVVKVVDVLDRMIAQCGAGVLPLSSYIFLLPQNHGKRIALFSMIKELQNHGVHVAPVLDIVTLNLLQQKNTYEEQLILLSAMQADIAFVYGTDFITRKLTYDIFCSLASSRALRGKPTILFDSYSHKEIMSWSKRDADLKRNTADIDHLSNPYILDGVINRRP